MAPSQGRIVAADKPLKRTEPKRMDPGWKPVATSLLRALRHPIGRQSPVEAGVSAIVILRLLWITFLVSWGLFLFVFSFLRFEADGTPGAYPYVLAGLGIVSTTSVWRVMARPLDPSSAETLSRSYQKRFFLAFARSQYPVLIGFVFAFLTGRLWLYLLGLPFGILGMLFAAPTRGSIVRDQHRLGSPSPSVLDALTRPLPARSLRKRRPPAAP